MKYNLKNNLLIWSIILATTLLFMIFFIDIRLATFIQNNIDNTSLLYKIFSIITLFGSFKYIVLINIIIFSYLLFMFKTHKNDKNYKGRFYIMIYGICGEILSVIATQLLKFIFGRSRPFNFFALNDGNMFTFFNFQYEYVSFPSGHSSGIWALIACLLFVFKDNKYSKILILFGLLISISRIILNVHYLSDVFFGATLSTFITWYTVIYLNKVNSRLKVFDY